MIVEVDKQTLMPYLLFSEPYKYNDRITLYPIKMKDILSFQKCQCALTLRKDAVFQEKHLIKMTYLEFIKYACKNEEVSIKYNNLELLFYYYYILNILHMVCGEDSKVVYDKDNLDIYINDCEITDLVFEDIRRIIIFQNDIDFDPDEFMNLDTLQALEKAKEFEAKKSKEKSDLEDYIDSVVVGLNVTEEYISNMTIRKFWRYVKRMNKHEEYQACLNGQMTGMVTFKEPIKHWMTTLEVEDKYGNLKTDEAELRSKVG